MHGRMNEVTDHPRRAERWYWRPWFLPAVFLCFGLALGLTQWVAGRRADGALVLAFMTVIAALFAFGGRSETIRIVRGDERDERWLVVDTRATSFAGLVVLVAVVVAGLWQTAHGRSPEPFAPLAVLAAVSYIGSLIWLRQRS